jgi:hypothetical protein
MDQTTKWFRKKLLFFLGYSLGSLIQYCNTTESTVLYLDLRYLTVGVKLTLIILQFGPLLPSPSKMSSVSFGLFECYHFSTI